MKKVPVGDAVGLELAHDITEIRPGEFKGPAFRKGHKVCDEDICHLQRLGKNHLYVLDLEPGQIHENEAAVMLAEALAGPGVSWTPDPKEGKIELYAAHDGMLMINQAALAAFNMVDEVMCATLHTHTLVNKGDMVAATRPIPLVMDKAPVQRAASIARESGPVVAVQAFAPQEVGLVITGSEVYYKLIEDRFAPILKAKVEALGSRVAGVEFAPDDSELIAQAINKHQQAGCGLILLTGGMSVDPDDVTRASVYQAGAEEVHYGAAVVPGAMFMVAYLGQTVLLGVPGCGLHHQTTVLDLILPRVLAGEKITKTELALLGHGGLCRNCQACVYPHCPFGKGS